ncbi:UDP-glucose 4-epimerase GalE [Brevibacterium luteolum]|uniref:UDP-glucose 4-epimerase n=1 Tax=Brevibacterium luteolum TaxID=199591 RepID=A0A6G8KWV9_9MICO|nr:UDP-glucose 4-epimerase GalE [Brevibacterium luteolum]QIN29111.1 UDP-glucose 4-epimerase GalE [Brevibacterium luteolum]
MSVLVTGGAGYIGSHVVRMLEQRGDRVVVVDDLSTGVESRVGSTPLERIDLAEPDAEPRLAQVISEYGVDSVIHFAAKKQVGESVEKPIWYYRQNVGGLANLLAAMEASSVGTMVFSSSAATYGMPDVPQVPEDIDCKPINPYGQTKLIGEWMIDNAMVATGLKAAKLRYFNVAGTAWDDLADTAVMNLVPIVLDRLDRGEAPVIFGDDYDTPDGTCIRDYVHVADLAEAHIYALDYLAAGDGPPAESVFNVGTGAGASVSEVIDTVARVLDRPITPFMGERRAGDPPQLVANVERIGREFAWKAQYDLTDIITSAVRAKGLTPRT